MFRIAFHIDELSGVAIRDSVQAEGRRAKTALDITSADSLRIFRCDTQVRVTLNNTGEVAFADFPRMDVLTWYVPEVGDQLTERFSFTSGNLDKGQWTLVNITPDITNPGIWDPGEAATIKWRFLEPQMDGTPGYVIIGAPNGVTDSGYVEFSQVSSSADCRFLHNYPTPPKGDTVSQVVLPMDTGLPSAAILHNYDLDRDSDPGLVLQRSINGLSETDPEKFQAWSTGPLTSPLSITGDVLIDLWMALVPPNSGETGVVSVYLRDRDGAAYTEIGEGAVFSRDWQSGSNTFVEKLAMIQGVNYTIPAGHEFEVRIIVDDASLQDMSIAYDASMFSSLLNLSFIAPVPTSLLYLHNNPTPPTGDTAPQAVLPLDESAPTSTTTLYKYSLPSNNPGLVLKGTAAGLAETDTTKYQVWRTGALASPMTIVGDVFIELWGAIRQFQQNQAGAATLYLRDFDGGAYTEIGSGSVFADDWQMGSNTFVKRVVMIPDLDYTVPAGHELEARLITDTVKASKDMWFAYDTELYPTVIKFP